MRLGVVDYRQKPLVGNEWVDCARALVSAKGTTGLRSARAADCSPKSGDTEHLTALVRALNEISTQRSHQNIEGLILLLARSVSNSNLGLAEFVGCAEALRRAVSCEPGRSAAAAAREYEAVIAHCILRHGLAANGLSSKAMARIQDSLARGKRPSQGNIASQLGVDVAALHQVLTFETGKTFTEWRSLLAMRLGVQHLAASSEQVSQIAYQLGFEHPPQFDREFSRVFGITPREFRNAFYKKPSI